MKQIDVSSLAAPVSAEDPAGPDLEYDPSFVALEDGMRIEPEQQFGDTVVAAVEPDWGLVRDLAVEVLTRSKDLRASVYLVQALTHGNGLSGLAQGLKLVRTLLEGFWDSLHPQLDPDEGLDPTARVNIVASLCDPSLVLAPVVHAPIVQVPGLGGISLRDVQIAKGQLSPPSGGEEPLRIDSIEAAIGDAESSTFAETIAAVEGAVGDAFVIEQVLLEKVGVTHAVGLDALAGVLGEIQAFFEEQLGTGDDVERVGESADGDTSGSAEDGTSSPGSRARLSGDITCPQDVVKALDKVIAYYRANEPSSPVPLLLERAKRLVSVGFMEILRDIAPEALGQAEQVTGASAETAE